MRLHLFFHLDHFISSFHPRLHAHPLQRRENLQPLCTPPLTSLILHRFQIREYMDERPDLLLSFLSALLPSPFFVLQEPSSNCCCSMDTRALFPVTHHTSIQILALEGPPPCHGSIQGRRNAFHRPHAKNFTCACTLFVKFTTPVRPTR